MERRSALFYFVSLIIAISITILVAFIILRVTRATCEDEKTCLTAECVQATAQIIDYLDTSINPCDNFYAFACGNFLANTEISEEQYYVSSLSNIYNDIQKKLRESLEETIEPNDKNYIKILKTYYQACNNVVAIEQLELDVIRYILNKVGGWPIVDGSIWKQHEFTWYQTTYKLKDLGLDTNFLISLKIGDDIENPGRRIIKIGLPELGLSRSFLTSSNHEATRIYYHYMISVAKQMGANESRAIDELNHSLEFEVNLAHLSVQDKGSVCLTLAELDNKYSNIPGFEYVRNMLQPIVAITKNEKVVIENPNYLKGLNILLGRTPKRVQANYIVWRAVEKLIPYLNEELRERAFAHESFVYDMLEKPLRWQQCVKETYERLPTLLSSLYIQKYFNAESKELATTLIRTIEKEFLNLLGSSVWMDDKSKDLAVMKASKITDFIAYPKEILDREMLEKIYSKLEVSSDDFLQSYLNISKYHREMSIRSLRRPSRDKGWFSAKVIAEMYTSYNSLENTISVSAGTLQGLLFSKDHPEYLNYGGLGFIISRDITQGFDWWETVETHDNLENIKCFIDQYDGFIVHEINKTVNGTVTLTENIADNTGLMLAYRSYQRWVEDFRESENLAALSYSSNQLFWISFAINQCNKAKPDFLKELIEEYNGTPAEFRVNGAVANSKDFANDFNCPEESVMNPKNKCAIV